MAVNNAIKTKLKQIIELQEIMIAGMTKINPAISLSPRIDSSVLAGIEKEYQQVRSKISDENKDIFKNNIKSPYSNLKLVISQYNKLIRKKPYSFVAKLMGHQTIA
ncbi:hypothetical protein [Fontibacter flavus]|uniref:Uncharacterized protein n=1 Tax=Fontibacter flavus TaxID=654838 RepID=A0ABV6FR55_9BACT